MANNPALSSIAFLEGEWMVELSNGAFLQEQGGRVQMRSWFEWIADGAALMLRQGDSPPSPPAATWIIGRDEGKDGFIVLYSDARGISRIYEMSFVSGVWKMWRTNPSFSQRFEGTVSEGGRRIAAHWDSSKDGGITWEHDFDMTYRRSRFLTSS